MVFAAVGALALVLLVGGLAWVRVYDDQLIRQTEGELIGQAVVVAETFAKELRGRVGPAYGAPRTEAWPFPTERDADLSPILPTLRASSPVLPAPFDPPAARQPADPEARRAGEALSPLLQRVRRSTLSGVRVVDARGVIVASSGTNLGASYADRDEVQRALRGAPATALRLRLRDPDDAPLHSLSRNAGVRVWVAIPVIEGDRVWGAVLASRTPMTLAKVFYADRWNLASTAAVLLSVLAMVSVAAAALVVRPLRAVVGQARAIAEGGPASPIATPVVEELAQLSAALSSMAAELRARNDYIRSFAASVSHELKTPLASIQGAAELLRDDFAAMPAGQRDKFLANIEADARRTTELVRRLLELARADAAEPTRDHADLAAVLSAVVERARAEGIAVELDAAPRLRAALPASVLEAVALQLVQNARQHGGPSVRVRVTADAADGAARVVVRDDGAGISDANRALIFEPFFTTARDRGGTGMGLTIARSLLRPFGGTLELLPDGPGAAFEIKVRA
jgi:signal transduction histidine kinase